MNREETEAYVLGTMLFDEGFMNAFPLSPKIFQTEKYRVIFAAMLDIRRNGGKEAKGANFIYTLINLLKMTNLLDIVGGEPEIVGLQQYPPDKNTPADMARAINLLKNSPQEVNFITNR